MASTRPPLVVLACEALRWIAEPRLPKDAEVRFLDYHFHLRPEDLKDEVERRLAELREPSVVLIGYGLCGNAVSGIRAGRHTLIILRTDDCIAMVLGSVAAHRREHAANPGTYYLTRGWIQSGGHPLAQYREFVERYGDENADMLMETLYRHYSRLCLIGYTEEELDECRPEAREIADFCEQRLGMVYEERLGSDSLIRHWLASAGDPGSLSEDLVVIPPGGVVDPALFRRESELGAAPGGQLDFRHSPASRRAPS